MSARGDALQREMAVRVELDADHAFRADNGAGALDDVAFDVVVAVRHHGAMQAEQQPVDRQGRLELVEDLVAHGLVVGAVGRAGGTGGKAAAFDQFEAFRFGARATDEQRRGAHARRIGRMLARPRGTPTRGSCRCWWGASEKVLVSVASVAVNRRMISLPPGSWEGRRYGDGGSKPQETPAPPRRRRGHLLRCGGGMPFPTERHRRATTRMPRDGAGS